jgi:hypothetical protein
MAQKLAQLGNKPDMLDLIATWRRAATAIGEGSLQMFLERRGWPRPLSDHIIENGGKAVVRLLADDSSRGRRSPWHGLGPTSRRSRRRTSSRP